MTDRLVYLIWLEASATAMVVGVFGSWVTVGNSGVSGTAQGSHGWIVLASALVAAGVFWFRRATRSAGAYVAVLGVVALGAVVWDRTHLEETVGGGKIVTAVAHAGWGLDLALAGSISLAVVGAAWVVAMPSLPWSWFAPSGSAERGPARQQP
jgi:hypothetical protein